MSKQNTNQEFNGDSRDWAAILKNLNHEIDNAEHRDRAHHTIHGEYGEGDGTHNSQNRFEVRPNHITNPETIVLMNERSKAVYQALCGLSDMDARIVLDYYLYSRSLKEIGNSFHISHVAVLKRKKKTLEILRQKLFRTDLF